MNHLLRVLPPIHELMKNEHIQFLGNTANLSPNKMTDIVRQAVHEARMQIMQGNCTTSEELKQWILSEAEREVQQIAKHHLVKVINGTGVVLHTNLGRAPLSQDAFVRISETIAGYSNLEFDLQEGTRGSRHSILEELIVETTGAEAAMVVNNNAAAVYLILRVFAKDKQVIVSRGELVEIGGSFRVSSIMEESDAKLVEVGTTNKTHFHDYEDALNEATAMLMKVHTSNFRIEGFTASVEAEDLMKLKVKYPELLIYEDLGSGALFDFRKLGIGDEPVVREVVKKGLDLISFSGDKLLGGPQAGVIVGKQNLINQLKKHQLSRVLRVDKMTLAALEATLKSYVSYSKGSDLPVIKAILKEKQEIYAQASSFVAKLGSSYEAEIIEVKSAIGGGTMPGVEIPSFAVALKHSTCSAECITELLRANDPAIVVRIKDDQVLIDFRTIANEEEEALIKGFNQITQN